MKFGLGTILLTAHVSKKQSVLMRLLCLFSHLTKAPPPGRLFENRSRSEKKPFWVRLFDNFVANSGDFFNQHDREGQRKSLWMISIDLFQAKITRIYPD